MHLSLPFISSFGTNKSDDFFFCENEAKEFLNQNQMKHFLILIHKIQKIILTKKKRKKIQKISFLNII